MIYAVEIALLHIGSKTIRYYEGEKAVIMQWCKMCGYEVLSISPLNIKTPALEMAKDLHDTWNDLDAALKSAHQLMDESEWDSFVRHLTHIVRDMGKKYGASSTP